MAQKPELPAGLKASSEASKAEYVNLGKSGLRVSVPIFGAMSIGTPEWAPWVMDEEKVCHLFVRLRTTLFFRPISNFCDEMEPSLNIRTLMGGLKGWGLTCDYSRSLSSKQPMTSG
jgi:hypothetical protein